MGNNKRDHVFEDFYSRFDPSNRNYINERVGTIENMIIRTMSELCMARFEWKNLPPTIPERYVELVMLNKGTAVFFRDEDFGDIILAATPAARQNLYGDPLGFNATGLGSFGTRQLKRKDCEPLYVNALRRTDMDIITVYAERLAQTDRTLEINTMNARQTGFAAIPEEMLLTAENVIQQINEGQRIIKVKGGDFGQQLQNMIQPIGMAIDPKLFTELHVLRVRWANEALGLLGIDNTNQDKKERLVEAEVDGNADQIAATRRVNLNQRQDFCARVNKHFDLDPPMSVDYYKPPIEPLSADEQRENDDSDGDVSRETSAPARVGPSAVKDAA